MAQRDDETQIAAAVRTFFDAFTSGPAPDVARRMVALREVLLPQALVVRTCGGEPTAYDVEGFIAPREALLTDGTLSEFREWEVEGRTEVYGDIAHHWCTYAKEGVQGGAPMSGRGAKTLQLVRTGAGWRISAAAWDDER
ncbi:nuclear transport factor 2 family protein [Nocardioides anomalus]|uniref:Nuclear transport factor 2 family protein n=1 Tax=Nocardioides anomalus TaxID=2712223 RepID=A0A6G6WGN7_9ACTN|nr:DUF4440 domain-containing protein [Nocardioides anomalus]QIG44323.1 nuclear transport factor 2 family protein [Nocardioides anomalus]